MHHNLHICINSAKKREVLVMLRKGVCISSKLFVEPKKNVDNLKTIKLFEVVNSE